MPRMDVIYIKPKNGKLFNVNQIEKLIGNTREAMSKDIAVDLNVTAQTFSNPPKAQIVKKSNSEAEIFIDDKRYGFINFGTRVRYATMTPDFQPKTVPRIIASQPGAGGLAYVSKANPRPGIKARHFDEEIAKKWNKLLPNVVARMVLAEL